MLKSMHLENLTVFTDETFVFGKNLNLIIGENGTGKTHILKAAYSTLAVSAGAANDRIANAGPKTYLQRELAEKLLGVFKPNDLGRLAQRTQGNSRCRITCRFSLPTENISYSFHTRSKSEVTVDQTPKEWIDLIPVFFPTRELLTIYPGFISLYETTNLEFDETWRDTSVLLGAPLARGPREKRIADLLAPLEEAMGGKIIESVGRFYLSSKSGNMEMPLVAEGLRKLGMVARLIATGSLLDKGYLFWDEPEANLNPRTIRLIAKTIMDLSQNGIQVFIATHSLFLMRELYTLQVQSPYEKLDIKCFGLHRQDNSVRVMQGATIDDIGDIVSLDEELSQSERYMDLEAELSNAS